MQVFTEPFNISFFSITGWGTGLDYCDIEWFALEMNRDHLGSDQDHPLEKKYKKAKWLSEVALQIAEKRREAKGKGEKERYKHLNAEF